jgi:hypothetical protein
MKEVSIQVSTFYLGPKLKKTVLPNGVVDWGMISRKYVQSAVQNVQDYLAASWGPEAAEEGTCPIFRRIQA